MNASRLTDEIFITENDARNSGTLPEESANRILKEIQDVSVHIVGNCI